MKNTIQTIVNSIQKTNTISEYHTPKFVELQKIQLTPREYIEILPLIQAELDKLEIPFEENYTHNLKCKLGKFKWEQIWKNKENIEFRMFNRTHSKYGTYCSPHFDVTDKEGNPIGDWDTVYELPSHFELVQVDNYRKCKICDGLKRPKRELNSSVTVYATKKKF